MDLRTSSISSAKPLPLRTHTSSSALSERSDAPPTRADPHAVRKLSRELSFVIAPVINLVTDYIAAHDLQLLLGMVMQV